MKTVRVNLTVFFDPAVVDEVELHDRLDVLFMDALKDCADWHSRWVGAELDASPLFGSAKPEAVSTDEKSP